MRNEERGTRNEEVVDLELIPCLFYSFLCLPNLDISINRAHVKKLEAIVLHVAFNNKNTRDIKPTGLEGFPYNRAIVLRS